MYCISVPEVLNPTKEVAQPLCGTWHPGTPLQARARATSAKQDPPHLSERAELFPARAAAQKRVIYCNPVPNVSQEEARAVGCPLAGLRGRARSCPGRADPLFLADGDVTQRCTGTEWEEELSASCLGSVDAICCAAQIIPPRCSCEHGSNEVFHP